MENEDIQRVISFGTQVVVTPGQGSCAAQVYEVLFVDGLHVHVVHEGSEHLPVPGVIAKAREMLAAAAKPLAHNHPVATHDYPNAPGVQYVDHVQGCPRCEADARPGTPA